jgi:hypothetical protein
MFRYSPALFQKILLLLSFSCFVTFFPFSTWATHEKYKNWRFCYDLEVSKLDGIVWPCYDKNLSNQKLGLLGNDHPHDIQLRRSLLTQAEKIPRTPHPPIHKGPLPVRMTHGSVLNLCFGTWALPIHTQGSAAKATYGRAFIMCFEWNWWVRFF